jgi:hypothetical protein
VVPPVVELGNTVFGLGWTDQQVSNFAIAGLVGGSLAVWQWLRNRGNWEVAATEAATVVAHAVEQGKAVLPESEQRRVTP